MENQETVQAYLEAWKKGDFKKMFSLCQLTWKEGKIEQNLKDLLTGKNLKDYELISSTTISSVCRKFYFELLFADGTAIRSLINVICEEKPYKTATFGTWGVNPLSANLAVEVLEKPEFTVWGKAPKAAVKATPKPALKASAKKTGK